MFYLDFLLNLLKLVANDYHLNAPCDWQQSLFCKVVMFISLRDYILKIENISNFYGSFLCKKWMGVYHKMKIGKDSSLT